MNGSAHLDLDGAWPAETPAGQRIDAEEWGPLLRYLTRAKIAEAFHRELGSGLPPFVLYGSGDFHHLSGLLLRRFAEPLHVVCFDNHPDWDRRPPRWACGAWVNRALELTNVRSVAVWGCGNFELKWPGRVFGNASDERLRVVAWAERQPAEVRKRFACVTGENWWSQFEEAVSSLAGQAVYVSIDLDCLRQDEAVTNWENGLFGAADLAWALGRVRARCRLVGGDVCGAWSPPVYATRFQRLAGWWDHPKTPTTTLEAAQRVNLRALEVIWPALVV